jgi:hypothetical protein
MKILHVYCCLLALSVALSATACVTPRRLDRFSEVPSGSLLASAPRAIVVERAFQHRASSFPSGRYVATVTNGTGVYYDAPEELIQNGPFGANTIKGGLYLEPASPREIRAWTSYRGAPIVVFGNIEGLSYRFEK